MERRDFLRAAGAAALTPLAGGIISSIGTGTALAASPAKKKPKVKPVEKPDLTLGFIKLTDMVPLAIAKEKGYFADEGLNVSLVPQANWKVLLDGVIGGQLDGAHMLAGQPLAATIGYGTKAELIAPLSLDLNGNAITLSNRVWDMIRDDLPKRDDGKPLHPISARALKPVIKTFKSQNKSFNIGMVFPTSTHNYELRYWLAAGGVNPGFYESGEATGTISGDVVISVTPPPQMPATMEAGTIDAYCVGEPWNEAAVFKKIGAPVITDHDIWNFNPEKVLGLRKDFAEQYPGTTAALIRAVIKAQYWLDENKNANRNEAVEIIAKPNYVGADAEVIAASMTGKYTFEAGDTRATPEFNIFFRQYAGYPYYSDAIWYLTQMRRWGQIPVTRPDKWYLKTAKSVYRPDLYLQAAETLVKAGAIPADGIPDTDGFKEAQGGFIDGLVFDAHEPNAYLEQFPIGLKKGQTVAASGVVGS
jgi:nitrate/nitrite transport system substrate-binding protein